MIDSSTKLICACPMNGKTCSDGVREDFPEGAVPGQKVKCRWWQHIAGKDPQSEKQVDFWDCAIAWLPTTTLEAAQRAHQAGASIDKVANVLSEVGRQIASVQKALYIEAVKQGQITGGNPSLNPPPEPGDE